MFSCSLGWLHYGCCCQGFHFWLWALLIWSSQKNLQRQMLLLCHWESNTEWASFMCLRYTQISICFPLFFLVFFYYQFRILVGSFWVGFFTAVFQSHTFIYTAVCRGTDRETAPASFQVIFKRRPRLHHLCSYWLWQLTEFYFLWITTGKKKYNILGVLGHVIFSL